ncbi:MAG: type IV pilus twitching motility protein PilT [Bdellovibrionales bacterium]
MTIDELLRVALQKGATDVHLKSGVMPVIRRHGSLRPMSTSTPPLTGQEIEKLAYSIMDEKQRAHFEKHREIDLGYGVSGLGRFRISIFRQRGSVRMVIRNIPFKVPTFEELNLPQIISAISSYERGLILITGVAGSGKSSTLAAVIDDINKRENKHILTIEDPIEYLIRDRKSLITQREIGIDSENFSTALRAGLRQDPDVILIGEMRDRETIEAALLAAETGHLVLSTLHTLDAVETINRILASFESGQQSQVRMQLAAVLKAVISQRLARKKDGQGMVPACEILINTPRVRELIEDPKQTNDIHLAIEEGAAAYGMQSFDQSLFELINRELITYDEALLHCSRPEDFRIRYEGFTAMDGKKWSNSGIFDKKVDDKWQNITEVEIILPTEIKKLKDLKQKKSGGSKG